MSLLLLSRSVYSLHSPHKWDNAHWKLARFNISKLFDYIRIRSIFSSRVDSTPDCDCDLAHKHRLTEDLAVTCCLSNAVRRALSSLAGASRYIRVIGDWYAETACTDGTPTREGAHQPPPIQLRLSSITLQIKCAHRQPRLRPWRRRPMLTAGSASSDFILSAIKSTSEGRGS